MEVLFLIGRIMFAAVFINSGISHITKNTGMAMYAQSKGVPMPRLAVLISGLMLIAGGLGIALGVYIKLSVFLLSVFLLSTLVKMHTFWKVSDPKTRASEMTDFMKNLSLLGACIMILSILEPWGLSL